MPQIVRQRERPDHPLVHFGEPRRFRHVPPVHLRQPGDARPQPETAWFELAPDWICEVLSPTTARTDRAEKLPVYAAAGVRHAWLIDPDLRTLETFENLEGRWLLLGVSENDQAIQLPPFDAITFPLNALWAD